MGQNYSAVRGFFRRYELIYVERDLVRLRTDYRKGEEVYLYRTRASAAKSRALFLDYVRRMNQLHTRPEWYNALTSNYYEYPHFGRRYCGEWQAHS